MKDYYKVLGVPRNATETQIKQAYRKFIRVCHPDINSSPTAAEWTRELNDAYAALGDAQAKMTYDMDLKLEEIKQSEASTRHTTSQQTRTENSPPPAAEPNFCCERCNVTDSTLRVTTTWRVFSFIIYARKSPTVEILCNRCRVKESLAANANTACLGWWGIIGVFWTLEALFKNAVGGEQSTDNNAALLNAVGYHLYRCGRHQEAYLALVAAFKLNPDPKTEESIKYLKQHVRAVEKKPFWEQFRRLELHPIFYHGPVGTVALVLLVWGFTVLNGGSSSNSAGQQQTSDTPTYQRPAYQPPRSQTPTWQDTGPIRPAFTEPELPAPEQGPLESSDRAAFYKGETAPLKITTRASDGSYVMKIVDWSTGEFIASYFIRRGSTLETEVPLGSYKLKFASGDKWYGTKYLFGPTTSYSYIPDKMVFYLSGDYSRGHRLELIPQVGGNLETSKMKADDW